MSDAHELTPLEEMANLPDMKIVEMISSFERNGVANGEFLKKWALENEIYAFPALVQNQQNVENFKNKTEKIVETFLAKNFDEIQKTGGDVENRDLNLKIFLVYIKKFDFENALKFLDLALEKTIGVGVKIDINLAKLRILFLTNKKPELKKTLKILAELIKSGGDWERKNRFLVYESLTLLSRGLFEKACDLMIKAIPTFTASELVPLEVFVYNSCILSVLTNRENVKKLTKSSEVLSILEDKRHEKMKNFIFGFLNSDYKKMFGSFDFVFEYIKNDRLLGRFLLYLSRQFRTRAYRQALSSYQSIPLSKLAANFNLSEEFLEHDLFNLNLQNVYKIDKVKKIVISKNLNENSNVHIYEKIITEGDVLLGKMQRLGKIVDIN